MAHSSGEAREEGSNPFSQVPTCDWPLELGFEASFSPQEILSCILICSATQTLSKPLDGQQADPQALAIQSHIVDFRKRLEKNPPLPGLSTNPLVLTHLFTGRLLGEAVFCVCLSEKLLEFFFRTSEAFRHFRNF